MARVTAARIQISNGTYYCSQDTDKWRYAFWVKLPPASHPGI